MQLSISLRCARLHRKERSVPPQHFCRILLLWVWISYTFVPFFAEEEDADMITWSERQKKSETNNPKKPI